MINKSVGTKCDESESSLSKLCIEEVNGEKCLNKFGILLVVAAGLAVAEYLMGDRLKEI